METLEREDWRDDAYHDWCQDMTKRLDHIAPYWRAKYENVDEAALAILNKTPYFEY